MEASELKPIDLDELSDVMDRLAAIYGRKQMAAKLGKKYNTLDNEIKHRELGTANAKLGMETALRMIWVALLPDSRDDAREAAWQCIDWMLDRFGMVGFHVPKLDIDHACGPILHQAASMAKEFGEAVQAVGEALADGKLARKEIQHCQNELRDVVRVSARLKATLRALEG